MTTRSHTRTRTHAREVCGIVGHWGRCPLNSLRTNTYRSVPICSRGGTVTSVRDGEGQIGAKHIGTLRYDLIRKDLDGQRPRIPESRMPGSLGRARVRPHDFLICGDRRPP
jgi:hypothetical protein